MYRLRWYCWAILNGGRFGELRAIYQGCRALPFALAGLSCLMIVIEFSMNRLKFWRGAPYAPGPRRANPEHATNPIVVTVESVARCSSRWHHVQFAYMIKVTVSLSICLSVCDVLIKPADYCSSRYSRLLPSKDPPGTGPPVKPICQQMMRQNMGTEFDQ